MLVLVLLLLLLLLCLQQELYKVDQVLFVDELASTLKESAPEKVQRAVRSSAAAPKKCLVHVGFPPFSELNNPGSYRMTRRLVICYPEVVPLVPY